MLHAVTLTHIPTRHEATLIAAAVFFILFFAFYRFSIPTRFFVRMWLAFLRTLLIGILAVILLDPYWNKDEQNRWWFGVLIDNSKSMAVVDENKALSRLDEVKQYFEHDENWKELSKHAAGASGSFSGKRKGN